MANNQFSRYLWLVDKVSRFGPITLEDLSDLWRRSAINPDGSPLARRTFFNHVDTIAEMFGIEIKNRRRRGYYIEGGPAEGRRQWMMSCMSVNNMLTEYKEMNDRILLEPSPQGQSFLPAIMDAIQAYKTIRLTYKKFVSEEETYYVNPYCVKLFRGRWYLLAYNHKRRAERMYALDRVKEVELTQQTFVLPVNFSAEEVFHNCYGVYPHGPDGKRVKAETIILRASGTTPDYLRTRPLHHSQKEKEVGEGVWEFSYRMANTYDLRQELLSYGPSIEVVSPTALREEIAEEVRAMSELYKKED